MNPDNPFDLSGRVALITGGSRGLGREIALAFARQGADLIIASRKLEACEAVAEEIRALGRKALAVACHLGDWNAIDALLETAYVHFERIDILVNNAGMSPLAPSSHETSEALFDKVLAVNFKGPFRLGALLGARMQAAGGGTIINVSSSGALRPLSATVPYCGAKAALNAMGESFVKEYGPEVRVNTLSAGPFLTDVAKNWPEELKQRYPNAVGRVGRPEEIVTSALFLASPLSSYATGGLLRVDGGLP